MKAVVMASAGYMGEGVKRNWQFVDYKSILSGAWYGPPGGGDGMYYSCSSNIRKSIACLCTSLA